MTEARSSSPATRQAAISARCSVFPQATATGNSRERITQCRPLSISAVRASLADFPITRKDNFVLEQLLGTGSDSKAFRGRAAFASPTTYINGTEPPFLILHGSVDPTVSPDQSRALRNALEAAGVPVHMYLVPGGVHGLSGALIDQIVQEFLDYYVKGKTTVITPQLTSEHDRTIPVNK